MLKVLKEFFKRKPICPMVARWWTVEMAACYFLQILSFGGIDGLLRVWLPEDYDPKFLPGDDLNHIFEVDPYVQDELKPEVANQKKGIRLRELNKFIADETSSGLVVSISQAVFSCYPRWIFVRCLRDKKSNVKEAIQSFILATKQMLLNQKNSDQSCINELQHSLSLLSKGFTENLIKNIFLSVAVSLIRAAVDLIIRHSFILGPIFGNNKENLSDFRASGEKCGMTCSDSGCEQKLQKIIKENNEIPDALLKESQQIKISDFLDKMIKTLVDGKHFDTQDIEGLFSVVCAFIKFIYINFT